VCVCVSDPQPKFIVLVALEFGTYIISILVDVHLGDNFLNFVF